jgi:membrane protease YdiL (CAAX protease family)
VSRVRRAQLSAIAIAAAYAFGGDLAGQFCRFAGKSGCLGHGDLFAIAIWVRALVVVPAVVGWWRPAGRDRRLPGRAGWLLPPFLAVWTAAAWLAFGRIDGDFVQQMVASGRPVLLLSATLVAAPISEELLFRGLLLDYARRWSVWLAAITTSLAWALLHSQYDIGAIAAVFVMGMALAGARIASGSIGPAMFLHAWWNAVVLVAAGMRW